MRQSHIIKVFSGILAHQGHISKVCDQHNFDEKGEKDPRQVMSERREGILEKFDGSFGRRRPNLGWADTAALCSVHNAQCTVNTAHSPHWSTLRSLQKDFTQLGMSWHYCTTALFRTVHNRFTAKGFYCSTLSSTTIHCSAIHEIHILLLCTVVFSAARSSFSSATSWDGVVQTWW